MPKSKFDAAIKDSINSNEYHSDEDTPSPAQAAKGPRKAVGKKKDSGRKRNRPGAHYYRQCISAFKKIDEKMRNHVEAKKSGGEGFFTAIMMHKDFRAFCFDFESHFMRLQDCSTGVPEREFASRTVPYAENVPNLAVNE